MPKNTIFAATAALVLAAGGAFAQSDQGTATTPGSQQGAAGQGSGMPMMHPGAGRGMMYGGPMMMMGDGPRHVAMPQHMMMMLMALVDTDASETLSLEEVQAVHARMFKYADTNDDGELTPDEMRAFMRGEETPAAQ